MEISLWETIPQEIRRRRLAILQGFTNYRRWWTIFSGESLHNIRHTTKWSENGKGRPFEEPEKP